ncbi:plasmid stability protein [Bacillus aryabhattai]|uniref:Plasmid stability protein n=1 Tax=Priestia aryabhattai TaxID=412384 RepID=A0A7W3NHR5_PRIAR|nr:hypothetical protein [Priestia aryabhattai]MBA9043116.1 plasmid stability protein [Priestia aryabhattai]
METEQEIIPKDDKIMRTAELSRNLKVAESTIRKYSLALEKHNYTFKKEPSNNNGRLYNAQDREILKDMLKLTENRQISIDVAAVSSLSRHQVEIKPSQQEAPRAPSVMEDERAEKFLERMQYLIKEETSNMQEDLKGYFKEYFKEEMRDVIEDAVEKRLEKERQQHIEEMRLLREQVSKVTEVMERREKKGFFKRLFGG